MNNILELSKNNVFSSPFADLDIKNKRPVSFAASGPADGKYFVMIKKNILIFMYKILFY
jgi:hypothetical protein